MIRGKPFQSIRVVPDSGTDGLQGLDGEMQIDIRGGEHFYTMEYNFTEQLPANEQEADS
jgi:hypothetical protein